MSHQFEICPDFLWTCIFWKELSWAAQQPRCTGTSVPQSSCRENSSKSNRRGGLEKTQVSLSFSDTLGFLFFQGTPPTKPHKPHPQSKKNMVFFSPYLLLRIVLWLNPQGSRRQENVLCMMKDLNKIAERTGPVPAPLTHRRNLVACQTFQNTRKICSRQLLE